MQKYDSGFTLVELIIVIAIIGILVSIALIAIDPIRVIQDTRDSRNRTELNQIKSALQLYFNENNDYPTAAEFAASGAPPNFTPTYIRTLPSVTTDTDAAFTYVSNGTDYDAGINLANADTDDARTVTACITGGSLIGAREYMICPD